MKIIVCLPFMPPVAPLRAAVYNQARQQSKQERPPVIKAEKAELRAAARARRNSLPPPLRRTAAQALPVFLPDLLRFCADFCQSNGQEPPKIFALYRAAAAEIDAEPLRAALRRAGKQTALPAIAKDGNMVFRLVTPQTKPERGAFGFYAPGEAAPACAPQAILLPLLAYDAAGHRLGQGGGHYDRALAGLRRQGLNPPLIGLAYSAQELPAWQAEPHDADLHAALTERGLRRF